MTKALLPHTPTRTTRTKTALSALAAAFAAPASAGEFKMKTGGYFETRIAFSSVDLGDAKGVRAEDETGLGLFGGASPDFDGVDVKRDAEIHFQPSITLNNGVRVGATVELEGSTSDDRIDESYISIDGAFGRVLIGSENSARYLMQYAAPDASGFGVNSGDATAHIPISGNIDIGNGSGRDRGVNLGDDIFRATLGSTYIENKANDDAERITWFTPRMDGLQLGLSYARDAGQDDNAQANVDGAGLANIADLGVNWVRTVNGVDLALGGGLGIAFGDAEQDPQVWNFGVNIGRNGWTVGGSFAEQNNAGNRDGGAFDAGIMYETGPWAISLSYFRGENLDNEYDSTGDDWGADVDDPHNGQNGVDETLQTFLLGARYGLAKGVDLNAFGAHIAFEEETGDQAGSGDDVSGFVFGAGLRLSF